MSQRNRPRKGKKLLHEVVRRVGTKSDESAFNAGMYAPRALWLPDIC